MLLLHCKRGSLLMTQDRNSKKTVASICRGLNKESPRVDTALAIWLCIRLVRMNLAATRCTQLAENMVLQRVVIKSLKDAWQAKAAAE